MRNAVLTELNDMLELRGEVTTADKRRCAQNAGVDPHTVNRWWRNETTKKLNSLRQPGILGPTPDNGCVEACTGSSHGRGCRTGLDLAGLPGWLYKFNEPGRLQLTPDEIAFFASHTNDIEAIEAVRADPNSRLRHYAPSTLYAAWQNVSEPIRVGAKRGSARQRAIKATYPLTGTDAINETWSIDEYDLKVQAVHEGVVVHPKALIVRERHSGTPLSMVVMPRAANGRDTGRVLAAAAIGYTVTHPYDPTRELRVAGVARYLNSDQGGPFLGDDGAAAARRLGIGLNTIPSHQPQANGDHEVMHQSLLRHFADGPGSRRGWTDRAGNRLDHGAVPFDTVVEDAWEWFAAYRNTAFDKGDREGMTRSRGLRR